MFDMKQYKLVNHIIDEPMEPIDVKIDTNEVLQKPKIEYGYDSKLNEYRDSIDNINNEIWKKIRWYINEYDFIVKVPIINRAFYKYWEMINEFDIYNEYDVSSDIILHYAEAPGGFIQGTNLYLQIEKHDTNIKKQEVLIDDDGFKMVKKNKKEKYKIYTMSLNKEGTKYKNYNLPSYNNIILNKYVCLLYGSDNSGNINNVKNIDYIHAKSLKSFYLITGDGGFDEGCNFNNKEQLHYNLILNEILAAIQLQKKNGHFILKMFDIFTDTSIHLLYLLSQCYKQVYIYKPITSRPTNSEKYIVCKYFNCSLEYKNSIIEELRKLSMLLYKKNDIHTSFTLFKQIPDVFVENIKHINNELLEKQCSYLQSAIHLCNNTEFLDNYNIHYNECLEKRKNIYKKWETYYNLNDYI